MCVLLITQLLLGVGKWARLNQVNHTSWVTVVTFLNFRFFPELIMSTDLLSFEHPSVLLFSLWQIFLERNITKFRQKFRVWCKELSKCFTKLGISITLCQRFCSNFEIFRMEIQNASTTPSKSNQLRNVNTVRWESRDVTTQPWEINDRKSKVIAFVVNAGMNVTTNNFYI